MRILYSSPKGYTNPDLVSVVTKIGRTYDVGTANCIFVDLFSYLHPINQDIILHALGNKKSIAFFDERDYGGMSQEVFNPEPFNILSRTIKVVYFMRKMDKTINYPDYVKPYEKTLYKDCQFQLVSKEELNSRHYDCCFIGNNSPQRKVFVEALINDGRLKVDVHWTDKDGKLPHDEWLNRHRQAKFFIESDGGGFGSERPHQLMTIAPMLKQNNNQLIFNDWVSGMDCVKLSEKPNSTDMAQLLPIIRDHGLMYSIYCKGAEKLIDFYTEEAMANYIIGVLKENGIK